MAILQSYRMRRQRSLTERRVGGATLESRGLAKRLRPQVACFNDAGHHVAVPLPTA
jgi:hypothetical protein